MAASNASTAKVSFYYEQKHDELVSEILELRAKVARLKEKTQTLANPASVGLAGFGLTTMLLQFHNIGWMEDVAPVVCAGFIFGGLAQLVAGLQEFYTGNNFGYSAFTTYGAFWISLALLLLFKQLKLYGVDEHTVGYFLVAFTAYTFFITIGAACASLALFITFVLLFVGFVLLDLGHFIPSHGCNKAAGWVLLFCSLAAWYNMLHIIYNDTFKFNLLPVGTAPVTVLKNMLYTGRKTSRK